MENLEKERYLRQMKVAELGEEGQEKLKQSTFLLIGAGGLGSPAAQLLAASGAGRLIIADFDTVLGLDLIAKAEAKRAADEKTRAAAAASFAVIPEDGAEDARITQLLLARRDAKKAKNFAEADRIRDELAAEGIELTDIPNGVKWKKI